MTTSQAGIDLIKSFEGCRLTAYQDQVGVWTIGYGDTNHVTPGMCITQEEADQRLIQRLGQFEQGVCGLVKVDLSQHQFDALVSFSYNLGLGAVKQSLLLRCINKHNFPAAAEQFLLWDHAGGIVVPGLLRRRQAERALFLS